VAKVNIKTKASGENTRLVTTIFDAEGKIKSEESTVSFGKEFDQNKSRKAKIGGPETPYLYKAVYVVCWQ
jgi:beta-galactosidase